METLQASAGERFTNGLPFPDSVWVTFYFCCIITFQYNIICRPEGGRKAIKLCTSPSSCCHPQKWPEAVVGRRTTWSWGLTLSRWWCLRINTQCGIRRRFRFGWVSVARASPQLSKPMEIMDLNCGWHLFILKTTLNRMGRHNRENHCIHYLNVKGYVNFHMNPIRHKGNQVHYELGDLECSLKVSRQTPAEPHSVDSYWALCLLHFQ